MRYVIYIGDIKGDDITNKSIEELDSNDEAIKCESYFHEWIAYQFGRNVSFESLMEIDDEDEFLDKTDSNANDMNELIELYRGSEDYYDAIDSYHPMENYAHVLSSEVDSESVFYCLQFASNATILHLDLLDVDVIVMNGTGMDLSDVAELAYYLCDGFSPFISREIHSVDKNLLLFCRKRVSENGYVSLDAIKEFLDGE